MRTLLGILSAPAGQQFGGARRYRDHDNLPGCKGPRVRQLIEAAGAELLFPPLCSSDFNPIENAFAKQGALLRKAVERTVEGLWTAIGKLIHFSIPKNAETSSPLAACVHADQILLVLVEENHRDHRCEDMKYAAKKYHNKIRNDVAGVPLLRHIIIRIWVH